MRNHRQNSIAVHSDKLAIIGLRADSKITSLTREEPRSKRTHKRKVFVDYKVDTTGAYPEVGDQVMVCHSTEVQPSGAVRLRRSSAEKRTVTAVYMSDALGGFSIRDHAGESWYVRPASIGGAKWETFVPGEKQKVMQ